jgi:Protein of unknown function (DUF4239)
MEWLFHLPVMWMTIVVIGAFAVVAIVIHGVVARLARRFGTAMFKGISPVMLTPLAVVFGLIVGFLSAQVWSDGQVAHAMVVREAGALRTIDLLASSFPGDNGKSVRALIRRHIEQAVRDEWPAMEQDQAILPPVSSVDTEMLQLMIGLHTQGEAERTAQREMMAALRTVIDARSERIIISVKKVDWVKWAVVLVLATLILVTAAMIHCDNPGSARISMSLFVVAAASSVVLIASHNRPFTGQLSVSPDLLVQVIPLRE